MFRVIKLNNFLVGLITWPIWRNLPFRFQEKIPVLRVPLEGLAGDSLEPQGLGLRGTFAEVRVLMRRVVEWMCA